MEYVSGPSLREVLDDKDARNGMGEDQALYFMRELIKGMRYLHDAGVVHRDLKPHNIFFEDGAVKIGDYSLSKAISNTHQTGHTTTVGSVHYMAPEIGEGKYNKAVDVYALGVILFEMLSGQPPYVGESMGEVLIKHITNEPDVSNLSEPFASTIKKAMARDPEERFQSVDEMLHSLSPDDHSSYLPPPASLSMIGDRMASRKDRQTIPDAIVLEDNFDTAIPVAALVDTAKASDSQPFERPGLPLHSLISGPLGVVLNDIGIWWRRSDAAFTGADSTSFGRRAFIAWLVCAVMLGLVFGLMDNNSPASVLFLITTLPMVGGVLTWAFLQVLPRSTKVFWTILSVVPAVAILMFVGGLYGAFLSGAMRMRFDDDFMIGFFWMGVLVDWRCYISTERYPRIGVLKTLYATGIFWVTALLAENGRVDRDIIIASVCVCAVVMTIQLFAPQYQIQMDAEPRKNVSQTPAQKKSLPWADWLTRAVTDVESKSEEEINA